MLVIIVKGTNSSNLALSVVVNAKAQINCISFFNTYVFVCLPRDCDSQNMGGRSDRDLYGQVTVKIWEGAVTVAYAAR